MLKVPNLVHHCCQETIITDSHHIQQSFLLCAQNTNCNGTTLQTDNIIFIKKLLPCEIMSSSIHLNLPLVLHNKWFIATFHSVVLSYLPQTCVSTFTYNWPSLENFRVSQDSDHQATYISYKNVFYKEYHVNIPVWTRVGK